MTVLWVGLCVDVFVRCGVVVQQPARGAVHSEFVRAGKRRQQVAPLQAAWCFRRQRQRPWRGWRRQRQPGGPEAQEVDVDDVMHHAVCAKCAPTTMNVGSWGLFVNGVSCRGHVHTGACGVREGSPFPAHVHTHSRAFHCCGEEKWEGT